MGVLDTAPWAARFIFSFNDETKIHPVLRDRLTIVKTKGFNREQKHNIAQKSARGRCRAGFILALTRVSAINGR